MRKFAFIFWLFSAKCALAASNFVGPVQSYGCNTGQFAQALATGTGITTCLSDYNNTTLANLINLGLANRTQTAFGPKPDLSSSAAGQIENARALTALSLAKTAWQQISVQSGTSLSTLNFSGANWSSNYNHLLFMCNDVLVSANGNSVSFVVGEGSGPSWETGAHYSQSVMYNTNATNTVSAFGGTTGTSLFGIFGTTTIPTSIVMYVDNVGSSSVAKMFNATSVKSDTSGLYTVISSAYWSNDTNPLTGIQANINSGTFSAICSLYGAN